MKQSKQICIVGAGLMGHGIAYFLARAGHTVRVFDASREALASLPLRLDGLLELFGDDPSIVARITVEASLKDAASGADFVIEAATEDLSIKQSIIDELEDFVASETIITSNTSALPITKMAQYATYPERIVGTHFWNPPHLVKLVEVVQAERTSVETVEKTISFMTDAGHLAVHVKKDVPGFIGNRLQHALKREAIAIVAAGICDARTLDLVVKHGFGKRMAVLGPLEQSDLVGLDLTKAIHESIMPDIDRTDTPHPYLVKLVRNGKLGLSTGEGFRTWTPEEAQQLRDELNALLLSEGKDTK